ncbi:MAG: hypothetical protein NTY23_12320 [Chloroflexi bacterium]|nr:hypothetical protein [Chloroflexota bacterium]
MKNADRFPYLSDIFEPDELVHLAALLEKLAAGYREFFDLPLLEGADTISPDEHTTGMLLEPQEAIVFVEDLRQQCWDLTDPAELDG